MEISATPTDISMPLAPDAIAQPATDITMELRIPLCWPKTRYGVLRAVKHEENDQDRKRAERIYITYGVSMSLSSHILQPMESGFSRPLFSQTP